MDEDVMANDYDGDEHQMPLIGDRRSVDRINTSFQRREKRETRRCMDFQRLGDCSRGTNCHFRHTDDPGNTHQTQSPGISSVHTEIPDMVQELDSSASTPRFVMCSHVSGGSQVFLVLVYGQRSVVNSVESVEQWGGGSVNEFDNEPDNVQEMQMKLEKLYETKMAQRRKVQQTDLSLGTCVSVKLVETEYASPGWYRGIVTERRDNGYTVFLVDHGADEKVPLNMVFKLDSVFTSWPKQAIRCRLYNTTINSKYGSVKEKDCRKLFMELKAKLMVAIFRGSGGDDCLDVELFDVNNPDESLNNLLVEKKILRTKIKDDSDD